jgi:hypothetical protein
VKYTLISSYFSGRNPKAAEFFGYWLANVQKHAKPEPEKIIVISVADSPCPVTIIPDNLDWISLSGDLGHCHHLLGVWKPHLPYDYSGWTGPMLAGAMLAYSNVTDYVFLEQDALAFGGWIPALYTAMGDKDMAFGGQMTSAPWMPSHQSVFIVRHSAIPAFVRNYLLSGTEREHGNLGEHKFAAMRRTMKCGFLPLTFADRQRPIPYDAPMFSAQQLNDAEIQELKKRGLI